MAPDERDRPESAKSPEEPTRGSDELTTRSATPAARAEGSIGPFKLLEVLGEGGMGIVYLAEQQKPVRRRVALKVTKLGMDTKEVIARFESERQALAVMKHLNIASVYGYGAGATESGRLYFAMEHVAGFPITEYYDQHRLTVRKRLELFILELFIKVCDGVQHPHQKGIIHRDIRTGRFRRWPSAREHASVLTRSLLL